MDKISKEFGHLSGEELFKPITKRLDEKSSTTMQEVEESPDYAMDEFDRANPFGDEFRPDAPTPAPSPDHHHQNQHHHPHMKMLTVMIFHHHPHR